MYQIERREIARSERVIDRMVSPGYPDGRDYRRVWF